MIPYHLEETESIRNVEAIFFAQDVIDSLVFWRSYMVYSIFQDPIIINDMCNLKSSFMFFS